ncbi:ubiquinol-cytochrome c reductase iron-sulfur subunit [Spirulina sp. CCNP1310]|uniref:ubiquinol-cytochrome c reductase iron-sulfur subunit n=1 Tax=Spirulina sp. CCNP1310 TaxID=3110249 RepID=UPI002B1EEDE4|nr:ubiquinol-cytochrome c reductase iron-sulfur subunit [Spirulina sp. CCNP1310]MEA5418943.1 ubiquinol-cytochrome c reductase iron-sulfur subunit [Spirulina sp. CCNP1310]
MERRQFLSWVGVGMLASSLPFALAACTQAEDSPEGEGESSDAGEGIAPLETTIDDQGFQALATREQLDLGPVLVATATVPVFIFEADGEMVALNPTCTHKGCTVELQEDGTFLCPCHAAKFMANGEVADGPAETPLPVFEIKAEGDRLLVKVGA